jgi:hypothetical protein
MGGAGEYVEGCVDRSEDEEGMRYYERTKDYLYRNYACMEIAFNLMLPLSYGRDALLVNLHLVDFNLAKNRSRKGAAVRHCRD